MRRSATLWAVLGAVAAGCGGPVEGQGQPVTGPLMRPGDNCLRCHKEGAWPPAPVWTAAGTVYRFADDPAEAGLAGVKVTLTDAAGKKVELTSNAAGNFYTPEKLATPFQVELEYQGRVRKMPTPPPAGSCNACHSLPPVGNAPGRIFVETRG